VPWNDLEAINVTITFIDGCINQLKYTSHTEKRLGVSAQIYFFFKSPPLFQIVFLGILLVAPNYQADSPYGDFSQTTPPSNPGIDSRDGQPHSLSNTQDPTTSPISPESIHGRKFPKHAGKQIAIPKLTENELTIFFDAITLRLQTDLGYVLSLHNEYDQHLPTVPQSFMHSHVYGRATGDELKILRIGLSPSLLQAPQFYMYGLAVTGNGMATNPEINQIEKTIQSILGQVRDSIQPLRIENLQTQIIQLSYANVDHAISVLSTLGITIITEKSAILENLRFNQLPLIMKLPSPTPEEMGLIGEEVVHSRMPQVSPQLAITGLSDMPSAAKKLHPDVVSSPAQQLLVLFHPEHPEQFSRVRQLLDETIDRPARQIFIEGMVLEISSEGLEELGVEWEFKEGLNSVTVGAQSVGVANTVVGQIKETLDGLSKWEVDLKALIREGKAEVLSRPSVLTLNNRQATIRVGVDIPIATSQHSSSGGSFSVKFNYIPTGILLNVRPRIQEGGTEISMMIDTTVSAPVPNSDVDIVDTRGDVLASAPQISTRRIQTYVRIENNTPLIIGGLVSKDNVETRDKTPILAGIPFFGRFFQAESTTLLKREVIIVLTPYVLPEKQNVARSLPKDDDQFDSFGNDLFRDTYRIRSEDTFDLSFLVKNEQLQALKRNVDFLVSKDFRLANQDPFKYFVGDRIPGEHILVSRMIYDVIKRLGIDKIINSERIIYFDSQEIGGFKVRLLSDAVEEKLSPTFDREEGYLFPNDVALAITYRYDQGLLDSGHLSGEPIPTVTTIPCSDRETWQELLWRLNQPDSNDNPRYTILIHSERDLTRLRRAILLKQLIALNGGKEKLNTTNFSIGKMLLIPEIKLHQYQILDLDVARYFFYTEHYYPATTVELEKEIDNLSHELTLPKYAPLLPRKGSSN